MATSCRAGDVEAISKELLAGLRTRRDELVSALRGRSLRVQVVVVTSRSACARFLLTAAGNAVLISGPALDEEHFKPDVLVIGTRMEVHAYLTGSRSPEEAATRGNLVCIGVMPSDLEGVRLLVADFLAGPAASA